MGKIHTSDPSPALQYYQREIDLGSRHPKFSKIMQPDVYRDIDHEKYQRFLKYAKKSLKEHGRYMKTRIAQQARISRKSVHKYFKRALEMGELEA